MFSGGLCCDVLLRDERQASLRFSIAVFPDYDSGEVEPVKKRRQIDVWPLEP
jgi:hypothetical protein